MRVIFQILFFFIGMQYEEGQLVKQKGGVGYSYRNIWAHKPYQKKEDAFNDVLIYSKYSKPVYRIIDRWRFFKTVIQWKKELNSSKNA